ncbi:hypothetical protein [Streptomyces sp. NPDC050535]|uniref:hypothetical protein n=1 Tax=Streptomyces sp. NPDC050535 TaxID=3365626 RepID=UPI00379ED60E
MDPVTLIVAALAAGAASGSKETAAAVVKDAYAGVKALAWRRLADRHDGTLVLERHQEAPDTWEAPLTAELLEAEADRDQELLAAAQKLLSLVDESGYKGGKYKIDVRDSQGTYIGDGGLQLNSFPAPTKGEQRSEGSR